MKNRIPANVFGFTKLITLLLVVTLTFFRATQSFAQCGIANDAFASGGYTPSSTPASVTTAGSGTFVSFNITSGDIYSFYLSSATTGTNGNDWDMTLANGSAIINYDDINTPLPNDFFGGIGCSTTTRPASAEWYSTYSGTLNVALNSFNGTCLNPEYVAGQSSATLTYRQCVPSGDPGPGTGGSWNVEAFATTALTIPNFNARYGYFNTGTGAGLNFKTGTYYTTVPSSAVGWTSNSCVVPPENWAIRARTTGLTCGVYTFVVHAAHDSVGVYLNGALLQAAGCCITGNTTFGSAAGYAIKPSDIIEVRQTGTCGPDSVYMSIVPVSVTALLGGTVGTNQTICNPGQPAALTSITAASGGVSNAYVGGGYTYDWYEEIGCTPPLNDLNSNTPGYTFPGNISNSLCIARTVVDVCGNSAVSNTVNITVNQPSTAPNSISATSNPVCVGATTTTLSVNGGSLGTGARWIWYVGGCGSGSPVDSGASITVSPVATTTYYVRAENPGPCSNPTTCANITVTVNPVPSISATPSTETICSGTAPSIALSSTVAGTIYTWTVAETAGISGGTTCTSGCGSSIGQTLNNSSNSATGTATYTISGVAGGCTSSTTSATITVDPAPVVTATPSVSAICSGNATNIALTSTIAGTTYAWSVVQGATISGGSSGIGTPIAQILSNSSNSTAGTATYTIIGTGGGCTGSVTATVTVNPTPVITPTPAVSSICNGSATDIGLSSSAGGTTYTWSVVQDPNITGGSSGAGTPIAQTLSNSSNNASGTATYTIVGTANSCTASATASVTVNPTPGITATPSAVSICSGSAPSIALTSSVGGTTYSWTVAETAGISGGNPGSGTPIAQILANSSNNTAGTATYTITGTSNSCPGTATAVITVNPIPDITATPSSVSICSGSAPSIALTSSAGGTTYSWSVVQDPNISGGSSGIGTPISQTLSNSSNVTAGNATYTITGTANSCSSSATAVVTVNPIPTVSATPSTSAICSGSSTGITLSSTTGGTDYTWTVVESSGITGASGCSSSCGSNIGQILSNSGTSAGTATCTVTGTSNSCSATATAVVTVNPLPNGFLSDDTAICDGNEAVITFNFTVGTGPFNVQYEDNFSNVYTATGVSNGNTVIVAPGVTTVYTFTSITDANGCTTATGFGNGVTITVNSLPVISGVSETDVLCNGGNTGTITITQVTNGTPAYDYSDNGGITFQSGNVFSGLIMGSYNLAVEDANGCSSSYSSNPVVVNQPTPVTQVDTIVDASCANVFNGSIGIIASGGTPPYSYALNNGPTQAGSQFTGLAAGNYVVDVYDAHGCLDTESVTINNSYALSDSVVTLTDVSCYGLCNGSVTVEVSGGTPAYEYSSNGSIFQSVPIFDNLCAQPYIITLRDSKGCTVFLPITITQPNQLSANIDSTANVLCHGTATGSLFTSVTGGTPPYTYLWSNGDTTQNDTGLVAGNYTVTIQDSHGCSTFVSGAITQPLALFVNVASYTNLNCYNDSLGSILINVSGGLAPYAYAWSNGDSTQDISGLKAGTYYVTVADNNGCQQVDSQLLTQPLQLTSTISDTNISCNGGSNGAVNLVVTGGTMPYSFVWNNGATTQNLSGVQAGTYVVNITDGHGCTTSNSIVVTQPNAINLSIAPVSIACNGSTVSVNLTVTGGTPGYTFSWNGGTYTTQDLTGVGAGAYTVVVTDTNSCTATDSITISQPAALTLSDTIINVTCSGAANGAIDLTIGGGTTPYSFAWSNGDTTQNIGNLSGNTYTVIVTDANHCSITGSFTINQPSALAISLSGTNVTCPGTDNGSASVSAIGGTQPYSYLWSTFQTTDTITDLGGGTYYVIVSDNNGCKNEDSIVITAPNPFVINLSVTNVACNGGATGDVNLTVSGGTGADTYSWNSGLYTTQNLTNVAAGTYTVVITDANHCTVTDSAIVTQPAALVLNGTTVNVACAGGHDGSVTITVNGGVFPYSYAWSNLDTTQNINGLNGGTYTVTVTDANGCKITASFNINEPSALTSTISGTNVTCPGEDNGAASVSAAGGTQPYTYLWNTFQTTDSISGLGGGTYYVVVTDNNGCKNEDSILITAPNPFVINISVTNVACNGGATGDVNLTVSGGTGADTYSWNSGLYTTQNLTNVAAGTYTVVITDANHCTVTDSATVTQPTALVLNGTTVNVACAGGHDGSVTITVNGGVFPYSYAWSNLDTTQNINGLNGGTYTVTVTDANGCKITASFNINEPSALIVAIGGTNITCPGTDNGTAYVNASGGAQPYTYLWNTFQTTDTITDLDAGIYYVIVTDNNGCKNEDSIALTAPNPFVINISTTSVLCNGGATGDVNLSVSGGTGAYTYSWNGGTYTTQNLTNITAGTYTVIITDANHCTVTDSAVVTQPAALMAVGGVQNVHCAGGSDGAVDLTVTGGTAPYAYAWSNGDSLVNATNLPIGAITVTITDANLCSISLAFNISEPTPITDVVVGTGVSPCHGTDNGSATLTVSGGTPPYTFFWSNFSTSQNISGLSGGTYFVIITDSNGCTHRDSVRISEPALLTLSVSATNISCFNDSNGVVTAYVGGGNPPYNYQWSNGAPNDSINTGLTGGNYGLTVTDATGCSATASATVINPPVLVTNFVVHNVQCYGDSNGSISLIQSGGTPNYYFRWSNGDTTQDIANLYADTFTVTVTDSRGCINTADAIVIQPSALYTSGVIKNVTCHGDGDGDVVITGYGGTLPYSYQWVDSTTGTAISTTQDIYGVSGGNYYVTVTDANNCFVVSQYIVFEPQKLTDTLVGSNVTCNGGSNGTAANIPGGGSTPYAYLWNDFKTDSARTGLTAGLYTVLLSDSNGCHLYDSIRITQPTAINIVGIVDSAICYGTNTGSISTVVTGGTPGYTYLWSNAITDSAITAEDAGPYSITVTDNAGCTASASYVIGQPTQIYTTTMFNEPSCYGSQNGSVWVVAEQGVVPYTYSWTTTPVQTTATAAELGAGTYAVTVTDGNGCTATAAQVLIQPDSIAVSTNVQTAKCFNTASGGVIADIIGGTGPYVYELNGIVQSSDTFTGLTPGTYLLLVTDLNGCDGRTSFQVSAPATLAVTLSTTDQIILTGMQTQLVATAVPDTGIVHYIWSPLTLDSVSIFDFSGCNDSTDCSSPLVSPPFSQLFTVTVENSDSCFVSDTITIYVDNQPVSFIPTAFTPNGDGLNDKFEFAILGANTIEISIFNRWGERVYYNPNQNTGMNNTDGWDGTEGGKPAPDGTYVYQMKITYFDGTVKNKAGTVAVIR